MGAEFVTVKKADKGVEVYKSGDYIELPAFSVEAVDTTGAGDSFNAGFIVSQIRGMELKSSLLYASAVAALKVTKIGSRKAPGHEETIEFLKDKGIYIKEQ